MKKFMCLVMIFVMALAVVAVSGFAEQEKEGEPKKKTSEESGKSLPMPHNFEVIIQKNEDTTFTAWTGQIFSIVDGKLVDTISPEKNLKQLASGNYVLMLHFDESIPELKGSRPFTFTISEGNKTTFTLLAGASQEPEMETGVGRSGADFIESDPRSGRDYVNFELPVADPKLCLAKCKKDPNCDAYSYAKPPEWSKARCWLIHGAAVPHPNPHAVSGVIQRDSSPYQVHITTEKLEAEK